MFNFKMRSTAVLLTLGLGSLMISTLHGAVIKVPDSIDFATTMAGFKYSYHARSATGQKVGWTGWLMPNGKLFTSGIYLGEQMSACASRGGQAEALLENGRRLELMKLALQAYNENQSDKDAQERGAYDEGPQLSIELGQEMANTPIVKFGPNSDKFRNELLREVQKVFDNPKNRSNALELAVVLGKDKVTYAITNIGKYPATILLPPEASAHFSYRLGEDEPLGLKYVRKPHQGVITLNPKSVFKIDLVAPKDVDVQKGLFLYDNMSAVYNDNPELDNSPKVQLCGQVK